MAAALLQFQEKNSTGLMDLHQHTPCDDFTIGTSPMDFTSPNYPEPYPNETDCVKVIDGEQLSIQT
jgi:hypothetical protein